MEQQLRRLLMNRTELNPFNDKFNIEQFRHIFAEYEHDAREIESILSSFYFYNRFHSEFYQQLASLLKSTDKDKSKVLDLIFAAFNRNYLVFHKRLMNEASTAEDIDFKNYASRTLQSEYQDVGEVNVVAMLETEVDSLTLTCNLLRHLLIDDFDGEEYIDPVEPIDRCKIIQYYSSLYYTLKTIYEDGLWNDGYFDFSDENRSIHVKFPAYERFFAKKAGHFRFQKLSLQTLIAIKRSIELKSPYGLQLIKRIQTSKNDLVVKDVTIVNGSLAVCLTKREQINKLDTGIQFLSVIETFYPFIDIYKNNSVAKGLSLFDFIILFSVIQEISSVVIDKPLDTSLYSLDGLSRYPIRIKAQELQRCLSATTKYSADQIIYFLTVISCQFSERVDLWSSPLLSYNEDYYLTYIAIISPIATNLVDAWLDKTAYKLDTRGPLFEKYIKHQIEEICQYRGFHCKVIQRNKFLFNQESEEIDVIFCLKDIAFICEAKCLKYSITPREDHNAYETLKRAAAQANRKRKFILNMLNGDYELKEHLDGKQLIPLIITNYTLFTGLTLEGVSVIDFFLIKSYLEAGKISSGYYSTENGITEIVELNVTTFYSNEEEMNSNILNYLQFPPPVLNLFQGYKITSSRFTPDGFPFEVWTQSCNDTKTIVIPRDDPHHQ